MSHKFYQDLELANNQVNNVQGVQITRDAIQNDEAVRKLQAETIADVAVQAKIIANLAGVAGDTFFSSQYTSTALDTKQPTMEIDAASSAYLEIVDGYKIKLKDLGIITNYVDEVSTSLADFIANSTFNGDGTLGCPSTGTVIDANTLIFLKNATNPAEKSFIYLGTNNGDETDFVAFSVDYNQSTIRTFFAASGIGMQYDASTGIYSLVLGNGVNDLGAHTVPVDSTEFSTVTGSTVLAVLKALEAYIALVDTNATGGVSTVETRLNSLAGVSGNNLTTFTQNLFSDNQSIKYVLQESEVLHKAHQTDRAAIRNEMSIDKATLEAAILAETTARANADTLLQANIDNEASSRAVADSVLQSQLTNLAIVSSVGDSTLSSRLDVVEGDASTAGSIIKAQADAVALAEAHTDQEVESERQRAVAAETALDTKIDNLAEGDITFVGTIVAGVMSIRQDRIDANDGRNGLNFVDIAVEAGETFVSAGDQTVTFAGGTSLTLQNGDKLMALDDVTTTAASDFNVVQADSSALTVANLDDVRIEQTPQGNLDVVANSIGRDQLDPAIEADVDDRRSLTASNTITSDEDTHFVTSTDLGPTQNVYWKRTQLGAGALTDTVRTVLGELHANTNGSANPLAPSYAQVATLAAHYQGTSTDFSVVLAGANMEANATPSSAINAVGMYGRSESTQLGINIGGVFVADGAAVSNVGASCFSGSSSTGKDRGMVAAVGTGSVLQYSIARQQVPFPYDNIAVVADAMFAPAGTKALYSYGDVRFDDGVVEVKDAPTTEMGVVRLSDVKATEKVYSTNLTNGVEKIIACPLALNKCLIQVAHDDETVSVQVVRDSANSQIKVTATGGDLTGCRIIMKEMSCDVSNV